MTTNLEAIATNAPFHLKLTKPNDFIAVAAIDPTWCVLFFDIY